MRKKIYTSENYEELAKFLTETGTPTVCGVDGGMIHIRMPYISAAANRVEVYTTSKRHLVWFFRDEDKLFEMIQRE